jgi:hypothetical protein
MPNSELLIYQASDGQIKLEVRLENETVWLTQDHMAQLFGKAKSTINEHIKNIFAEGELDESQVMKKFGISAKGTVFLQSGCDHLGRLSSQIAAGHAIPYLGDAATERVHRQGFCLERRLIQERQCDERFQLALEKSAPEYEKYRDVQKKSLHDASLRELERDPKQLKPPIEKEASHDHL